MLKSKVLIVLGVLVLAGITIYLLKGASGRELNKSFEPWHLGQTYHNEQYGFELNLPEHFKAYQIKQISVSDGSEQLFFYATTTDKGWSDSDLPNGYVTLFSLSVMPIAAWTDMHNKCVAAIAKGEGDPYCGLFESFLLKNDKIVVYNTSIRQASPQDPDIFPLLLTNEYLKSHIKFLAP